MSKKDDFFVLNSDNIIPGDNDKPRVKKPSEVFGSTERGGLADITNMQQPRASLLDEKSQFIRVSTKEYIDMKKENMTLMKLLAHRNKIIELTAVELNKLRDNMQKLQKQNLQLARSNSQLLEELAVNKDRLKLLQHSLGCKKGLQVAKELQLKEKGETSQKVDKEVELHKGNLEPSEAFIDNTKPTKINGKQHSKSLGSSNVNQPDEKACNKRRRSARFKSEEPKPADDLFEVESSTFPLGPVYNDRMKENFSSSMIEKEDKITNSKRIPVRRQSGRFKSEEPKPAEELFAVDSDSVPILDDQLHESVSTSICLPGKKEDKISEGRRLSVRRKSARLKPEEPKPADDLFRLESTALDLGPVHSDRMKADISSSMSLPTEKEDKTTDNKRIRVRKQPDRYKSEEPKPDEDLCAVDYASGPIADNEMHEIVSTCISLPVIEEEKVSDSRRLPARRQSAKPTSEEPEPGKEMFEKNTKDHRQEAMSTSTSLSNEKDNIDVKYVSSNQLQDLGRPSMGRPSRHAAKKVNSYKEVPLNVKMRRTE